MGVRGWGGAYPDPGGEDDEDPIDDHEYGEESQQDEPEPDEDVDLLIYWNKKKTYFLLFKTGKESKDDTKDIEELTTVMKNIILVIYMKISLQLPLVAAQEENMFLLTNIH
jgi:hypothetical protein